MEWLWFQAFIYTFDADESYKNILVGRKVWNKENVKFHFILNKL